MTMPREALRAYLRNPALTQALRAMKEIDQTRKDLMRAADTLRSVNASQEACAEVETKITEYGKIKNYYGNMIEDLWHISWHWWTTLEKHLDYDDEEIDALPDCIKTA